jgi:hypothetical protein
MKKMYICVKESIPSHKCLAVAHGVLMAHLKFQPEPDYQDWLTNSFRKVVCEVSDEEFESLKTESNFVTVTESALDGIETGLVFCPREVWPKKFKFYPLLCV